MTTFRMEPRRCAVCGAESEQSVLTSTSTFGAPDLDTRPAELARSTIWLSVQTCPSCGYSAERLEEGGVERAFLETADYLRPVDVDDLPDLALRLLRAGMVADATGDAADAGWITLRAAWVCDDDAAAEAARACRERAVEYFRAARERGQEYAADPASGHAIVADVLRRAGRFPEAIEEADAGLAGEPDGVVRSVLERQRELSDAGDTDAHRVGELDS